MLPTTETLLQGLAEGNDNRWARFYRDYAPALEALLFKKCHTLSHEDVEDLISETMIAIAKLMPTYHYDREKYGAFRSLLAKIAQNKLADLQRKRTREATKLEHFAAEPLVFTEDDWRRETFNMALRRVFADSIIHETSKIAFRRVVQQGEDVNVVARDLGLKPNAIYQIQNRIKERLRDEVRKIQADLPDGFL